MHLFTIAGECTRALDLCVLHNIAISEEVAERMCPPLGARGAETAEARSALLAKIAKCCKRQGNYHLACKKYTQVRWPARAAIRPTRADQRLIELP